MRERERGKEQIRFGGKKPNQNKTHLCVKFQRIRMIPEETDFLNYQREKKSKQNQFETDHT